MEQSVTTSKTLPTPGTRLYEMVAGTILLKVERDKTICMNVIVINMKFKTSNLRSYQLASSSRRHHHHQRNLEDSRISYPELRINSKMSLATCSDFSWGN
ncbi:hypothetical protein ACO22_04626 [Paracoccidioides brasiliensis]|uniref:Uncharacterized protein n=1 Tax=Paracoccidioides brasiliensis TaxID=121759 RepID=A0A1D2JCK5_PARBR|nr:hypothetical protein ACO22_04626 [Paracoccidioides brasiliensis]